MATGWLIADLTEFRGKQELFGLIKVVSPNKGINKGIN